MVLILWILFIIFLFAGPQLFLNWKFLRIRILLFSVSKVPTLRHFFKVGCTHHMHLYVFLVYACEHLWLTCKLGIFPNISKSKSLVDHVWVKILIWEYILLEYLRMYIHYAYLCVSSYFENLILGFSTFIFVLWKLAATRFKRKPTEEIVRSLTSFDRCSKIP